MADQHEIDLRSPPVDQSAAVGQSWFPGPPPPIYSCTLSPELVAKAREELQEKPEWRLRDVQALRDMILKVFPEYYYRYIVAMIELLSQNCFAQIKDNLFTTGQKLACTKRELCDSFDVTIKAEGYLTDNGWFCLNLNLCNKVGLYFPCLC